MFFYKVTKRNFEPSQFAICENAVFVYNRALGGAFEHYKRPREIFTALLDMAAEGFTVEKSDGAIFERPRNWFCIDDFKAYVMEAEK